MKETVFRMLTQKPCFSYIPVTVALILQVCKADSPAAEIGPTCVRPYFLRAYTCWASVEKPGVPEIDIGLTGVIDHFDLV